MSLSSFLSREVKFAEAAVISITATTLSNKAPELEALVESAAPQAVADVVGAVEKADKVLGPAESAMINGVLGAYEPQINEILPSLVAAGEAFIPKVVAALQSIGGQLQTEALASK